MGVSYYNPGLPGPSHIHIIKYGQQIKAGVNVKAVSTSFNTANISVTFQATLDLSAYFVNHCLAVLCKFLGDFWAFWERDIFFSKDKVKLRKI